MTGETAIAILRDDLGLSGVQAAALLGLHRNTIYNWARGEPVSPLAQRFILLLRARPEMIDVLRREVVMDGVA